MNKYERLHMNIYIYIYMYICICICICVALARMLHGERQHARMEKHNVETVDGNYSAPPALHASGAAPINAAMIVGGSLPRAP